MRALARRVRPHLSYATVVSSLTAFVVLCGGAAFAANQLAKNSVGKKQLKANAVTTAKIKKNAVTKAKIRNGAVDASKVKDGSLGAGHLNLADMPFQRIVHEARSSGTTAISGTDPVVVPLDNASYTQAAGEDNLYQGALDFTFHPGCEPPRQAFATLLIDTQKPTDPPATDRLSGISAEDSGTGLVTKRVFFGGFEGGGAARFQPDAPTGHALTVTVDAICAAGSGVTASGVAIDVIGVK
jgi:hypothetical protein